MDDREFRKLYECEWPAPKTGDIISVEGEIVVVTETGTRPATREERRWYRESAKG